MLKMEDIMKQAVVKLYITSYVILLFIRQFELSPLSYNKTSEVDSTINLTKTPYQLMCKRI